MTRTPRSPSEVSRVLGEARDRRLLQALARALAEAGAVEAGHTWHVAGLQEVETWEYRLGRERLTVRTEKYVGLTLSGPAARVDAVVAALDGASGAAPP
jgi:ABC-type xylose transport system substrate-binding protein